MDNVPNQNVICQCLKWLHVYSTRHESLDYRAQKLFVGASTLLFVEAQLQQRDSYKVMSEHVAANPEFQDLLGLKSISASQLSRKLKRLPMEYLQTLFFSLIDRIKQLTKGKRGITPGIGKLKLIDSSGLTLPPILAKWSYCSKSSHGVKMHTSLVVVDSKTMYPDKIVASTKDVADHEVVLEFTVDKDATYVMDRGYQVYDHFQKWVEDKIKFVCRVKQNSRLTIIRKRDLPKRQNGFILDADVTTPEMPAVLRLIEFNDDQGRTYRIVTNRFDLSAYQIAEIYRNRWHIELFFKWVKQHIRLVKPHGYTAEAIWNQMYIALIAYALCLLIKLTLDCKKSTWDLLQLIRIYAEKPWENLIAALNRKPTRTSRGRPKRNGRRPKKATKSMKPRLIVK
ncbi:IS4 family transposase [Paenibacillus thiaminolyticus]|uniref:IS4 family transposase n=1 Tax=Paenibacillus thiaminolyticus TaxID=49283 RepID=UPI003D2DDB76